MGSAIFGGGIGGPRGSCIDFGLLVNLKELLPWVGAGVVYGSGYGSGSWVVYADGTGFWDEVEFNGLLTPMFL